MKTIRILEGEDTITALDWCRPLSIAPLGYDDCVVFESMGRPINNAKWVQVRYVLGPCWWGKTVEYITENMDYQRYEFVAGDIPDLHKLDVSKFRSFDSFYLNPSNKCEAVRDLTLEQVLKLRLCIQCGSKLEYFPFGSYCPKCEGDIKL